MPSKATHLHIGWAVEDGNFGLEIPRDRVSGNKSLIPCSGSGGHLGDSCHCKPQFPPVVPQEEGGGCGGSPARSHLSQTIAVLLHGNDSVSLETFKRRFQFFFISSI